ncbi:MAG: LuxR C-terminal-related transcriptional regulator [Raoultibacter sp.]
MREETGSSNVTDRGVPVMQTPSACILATVGFACLTAWGTYLVFVPALPLLSFAPIGIGVACLLLSRLAADVALFFCAKKPDFVFDRLRELIFPLLLVSYLPVVAIALLVWGGVVSSSTPLSYAVWILCGLGDLSLSLAWMVLFSMMSARWTALSIASGGALATPLFLLVAGAGSPILSLVGIAFVLGVSGVIAFYLLTKTGNEPLRVMKTYQRYPVISPKAALSVGSHGMVYGFVVIMLCIMGKDFVLVAASAGIVGSGVAILWAIRRTKSKWDTGVVQRITIPIVVAALLFVPFFGDVGRVVLGAIAVGTFAYATLMEWTDLAVANYEFQLYPVKRYACGRLAQWAGFLIGGLVAFLAFYAYPLSQLQLIFLSCTIAVVVVAVFSIYGADDSGTKEALLEIMVGDDDKLIIEPPKNAAPFRSRCDDLVKKYQLSSREAEVFNYLAKGRNAEYIQQKLFISGNTVKTHICHIYKKMNINSQQRLIDYVDQRNTPQEDAFRSE